MLNVNVMGFLHNEETKMSTVRATSRVQAIRSRTASIQQRNAEKAAAEAAKNATKPKTTATPKVQEIRDRTAAIQQRNAEKVQGTGSVKTNVSTVKSPAKAPNKDTVSISARSNASSYAGQYKDMSDESLDKTINNLKNTIKNSKSGTATYYAQKALEGYQAEKERRSVLPKEIFYGGTKIHSFYNKYSESKYGTESSSKNIFTNLNYQKVLLELPETYSGIAEYQNKGYKMDGYTLIGICFGESNAHSGTNLFGSTTSVSAIELEIGKKSVETALIKTGICQNANEARQLICSDDFYLQTALMIGHLENGLNNNVKLESNYQSYEMAEKNAERWRWADIMSVDEGEYSYNYF